jgi:hypothetical protein
MENGLILHGLVAIHVSYSPFNARRMMEAFNCLTDVCFESNQNKNVDSIIQYENEIQLPNK